MERLLPMKSKPGPLKQKDSAQPTELQRGGGGLFHRITQHSVDILCATWLVKNTKAASVYLLEDVIITMKVTQAEV